ncbi:MAG: signal peptidase I [Oscillospiraceae bacterium]|nr:signal peptidase I [Oscillospiraceae bacterium]
MTESELKDSPKQVNKGVAILFEIVEVMVLSLVSVFLVSTFVYKQVNVVGNSMFPTLHDGDRVILFRYIFSQPKNGDVVVVTNSKIPGHKNIIKRIIASEGQKLKINSKKGEVYLDGVLQDEPYIKEPTKNLLDLKDDEETLVPRNHYFVMGDARNHSTDSRAKIVGFVDKKDILGKTSLVVYPLDRFKVM